MKRIRHVVFDVDDVIVDTDLAVAAGERATVEPLARKLSREVAERVARGLGEGYARLIRQLRSGSSSKPPEYLAYEARIRGLQAAVVEAGHEVKLWSRDTLLAIALEDEGHPFDGALVAAASARYWRVVAERTEIYPDAQRAVAALRARGLGVHLATNSDGFLVFDPERQELTYDPEDAVRKKIERLALLERIGLGPRDISVGDPIGKPHPAFFEKVLRELGAKVGEAVDPREVLPIGDSLLNDVLPLVALGAPVGLWLVRGRGDRPPEPLREHPTVLQISCLDQVPEMLERALD